MRDRTKSVEVLQFFFLTRLIFTLATPTEKTKEIGRQIVRPMKLAHVTEPTNRLSPFRELISWKTALVIEEQFSGTAFPVMWEKLNL